MTGGGSTRNFAIYIISPTAFFVIETDTLSGATQIASGRVIVTGNSYTAASVAGKVIVHATGRTGGVADVNLGLLTLTAGGANAGTLTGSITDYNGTTANTNSLAGTTYAIDPASGRTTLTGPTKPPVIYVTTPTDGLTAFIVGTDTDAIFGLADVQATTTAPAGTLLDATEDPGDYTVANLVGLAAYAAGAVSFTQDSSDGGLFPFSGINGPYTLSTNADGTGMLVVAGAPNFYITNTTKLFLVVESGTAVVEVDEQ